MIEIDPGRIGAHLIDANASKLGEYVRRMNSMSRERQARAPPYLAIQR